MDKKYRDLIAQEFRSCVNGTIARISESETYRPFHTALLSEEVIFWSRFERSFSTSFGQRVMKRLQKLLLCQMALNGHNGRKQLLSPLMRR